MPLNTLPSKFGHILAFQMWSVTDLDLPQDAREFLETGPEINIPNVDNIPGDFVRASITYPDILGNAAILLTADIHKGLTGQEMVGLIVKAWRRPRSDGDAAEIESVATPDAARRYRPGATWLTAMYQCRPPPVRFPALQQPDLRQ